MKLVHVATDGWNFVDEAGEFITPLGGNMLDNVHPAKGTLFQNFNKEKIEYRFKVMSDNGLNTVRQAIGINEVFDIKKGLKNEGLKNWDTFLTLAEKYNVYIMAVGGYLGSNDWFDSARLADDGEALKESCSFWEAFVSNYAGHPAIFAWDLRNELLYDTVQHMVAEWDTDKNSIERRLKDKWAYYLERMYGTVGNMNKVYGSSYSSFKEVRGSVKFEEDPYDLRAYDFRRYLNYRGYNWCKAQCDIIRAASPKHMIVSGNNAWLFPDQVLWLANGFHNIAVHDLFDFVTHHPYPAMQASKEGRGDPLNGGDPLKYWLNSCIGMSRLDNYHKPMVLQEFGWYGGGESQFIGPLPYRSEKEHADYTDLLCHTLIGHVNGFVNWPLFDMPDTNDTSNHGGIFTHDGHEKELTKVYKNLSKELSGKKQKRISNTTTLTYSLLALYTNRKYQDDMWDEVNEVLNSGDIPDFKFI